ncbi:hypothetical protein ACU6RQ_12455 [Zobellella denitrificans]
MAIDYRLCVKAAFEPIEKIVISSHPGTNMGELKLLPPIGSAEEKELIFNRFKNVSVQREKVSYLNNGDFFVYFKCEERIYLCISVEFFTEIEIDIIISTLSEYRLFEAQCEEAFFVNFFYTLRGIYKPKLSWTSEHLIQELGLGLRENLKDYKGHSVTELVNVYSPLIFFEVGDDSALLNKDNWYLSCLLSVKCCSLRSSVLNDDIFDTVERLMLLGNVSLENIYLSITSSHYKYSFIEIYRCLEAVYYLPWMIRLRDESGLPHDAFELARIVSKSINWRRKEEESLRSLFSNLPFSVIDRASLDKVSFISPCVIVDDDNKKKELGSLVYKLRNQSVHYSAYEHTDLINVLPSDWVFIIEFMYLVVEYIYREHQGDVSFHEFAFPLD